MTPQSPDLDRSRRLLLGGGAGAALGALAPGLLHAADAQPAGPQ